MKTLSPWAIAAKQELQSSTKPISNAQFGHIQLSIESGPSSLWAICNTKNGQIAFRVAYSPDGSLNLDRMRQKDNAFILNLSSSMGKYKVRIDTLVQDDYPVLKYTTTLSPTADLLIPFWPRDIIFPGSPSNFPKGEIHVSQVGTRSGQLYFSAEKPDFGAIFYLQNLTSLASYNQDTQTSAGDTVGGIWPELGFALPPTTNKPLLKDIPYIVTDAIIAFDEKKPKNETELANQYLNMLGSLYLQLPRPSTHYNDWPEILKKGLHDLIDSSGCWSQLGGNHYFNAYLADTETPPEIMVQLAVLLPLLDYTQWSGEKLEVIQTIKDGLPAFWDQKLGTLLRWHPAAEDKLKGEEEQKKPLVMDSWYLNHPLLNLSRLALMGDKAAAKLFLDAVPFAIKVAKHFNYNWPVFYKMDTLKVIKAETKEGEGGQHDVAGLHAHVMLQAYELTGKAKYLNEAKRAARSLKGKKFKLFYQANNTAFSAGALLRLYKLTKDQTFLELSYLCLAGIFQNVQLWDCNYGYGKYYPTFFALFPLSDAPYTAAYEEQEVFCALHDYLSHAKDVAILPAVKLLCSEYIRNLVNRAPYYYPPFLPEEMLSSKVKTGEIDKNIYVALEDLHDGWEQSGQVGQEVYGAGNAFGVLPRHYVKVENESFMLYADYPISGLRKSAKSLHFFLEGDRRISCRLRMITASSSTTQFKLSVGNAQLKETLTKERHLEFILKGQQGLTLSWSDKKRIKRK